MYGLDKEESRLDLEQANERWEEEEVDTRRSKKRTRRIGLIVALCIFSLCAGTVLGGGLFFVNGLAPMKASDEEVRIVIEPGTSSTGIANLLEEKGLIRSAFVFRYYLRMKNEGSRFQAGEYSMKPGMELDEMITMMNNGDTVGIPTLKFTIPEGMTIEQIADKLDKEGIVNREKFMQVIMQPEGLESEYVAQIPDDPDIQYKLEGYLFPETYEMVLESTEHDIVQRMIVELERKLQQLPEDWSTRMEQMGLTMHEMLTIASLIEREAAVAAERPIISSVIHNRLEQGMQLQIDATVQYALEEYKDVLLTVDTQVDSPYNTYKISGLPPGPIANPGLESIRAALYPEETNYLFYVTKKDGTQEHYFAETHSEHLRNKAISEQQ